MRFRDGLAEKIGGWQRFSQDQFLGTARSLFGWSTLIGEQLYALGTNLKFYIVQGGSYLDVTPIRRSLTLGNNPFTTVSAGSTLVTVFDDDHGANPNDFVIFAGATGPVDGIPASELNTEHQIVEVIDSDNYRISVTTPATAGVVNGGGAAVTATYQINVGLNTTALGLGWGAGPWGFDGWGSPSDQLTVGEILRLWHQDSFGEDLVFNVRDGAIYYIDVSAGLGVPGVLLSSRAGATDVPVVARQVLVSNNDRHVIAFACNAIGQTQQDLLLVRWSNQENAPNWNPLGEVNGVAATAGELRLNEGSEILRALETQREILIWTDTSLHSMRFLGTSFATFGQEIVGSNISLIAPNAVVSNGTETYWMGEGVFYLYDGRVTEIPCDIEEFVFRDLTTVQREKITAGVNRRENEIWWFMPRGDDPEAENNFYVVFNYKNPAWYYGTIVRTVYIDSQFEPRPLAAGTDGYLYLHETGFDDGSTNPPSAIEAYVTSSLIEIGDGERFMFVRRIIPDVTFRGSTEPNPSLSIILTPRNYPGGPERTADSVSVMQSVEVPIEQYDAFRTVRLRGRMLTYEVRSTGLGVAWRHGTPRLDAAARGKR